MSEFFNPTFSLFENSDGSWTMFVHGTEELRTYTTYKQAKVELDWLVEICCD